MGMDERLVERGGEMLFFVYLFIIIIIILTIFFYNYFYLFICLFIFGLLHKTTPDKFQ